MRELLVRILEVGNHLHDAAAGILQPQGDAEQLLPGGGERRRGCPLAAAVVERAGAGKTQRAGLDGFRGERAHPGDLVGAGGFTIRAPLAHDVDPERAVGQLGTDVHVEGAL